VSVCNKQISLKSDIKMKAKGENKQIKIVGLLNAAYNNNDDDDDEHK